MSHEARHIEAVLNSSEPDSPLPPPSASIHFTNLPESHPGTPLSDEWNTYRRELPQWLAEGHEGRYVLIKGPIIHGFFTTFDSAVDQGEELFPDQDFLAQPILEYQPLYRGPWRP
jgi:hypothetical protein